MHQQHDIPNSTLATAVADAVISRLASVPLPPPQRILNCEQAAAYLCVSTEALKLWRAEHRGPAFKRIGNRCVYTVQALDSWVDAQPEGSTGKEARS